MANETAASTTRSASAKLVDAQGQAINEVADQAQATGDQLVEAIRRQPIAAALIILVIGYVLGKVT